MHVFVSQNSSVDRNYRYKAVVGWRRFHTPTENFSSAEDRTSAWFRSTSSYLKRGDHGGTGLTQK